MSAAANVNANKGAAAAAPVVATAGSGTGNGAAAVNNAASGNLCKLEGNPCIGKTKNTGENEYQVFCEIDDAKCFKTQDSDRSLFDHIEWKKFSDYSEVFFEAFMKKLLERKDGAGKIILEEKLKTVFTLKDSYKLDNPAIVQPYLLNLVKEPTKCMDINFAISFPQRGSDGKWSKSKQTDFRLFHIALHSELPVYVRSSTRSRDGCAAFEKKEGANAVGSGTFHYKIDSLPKSSPEYGIGKNRTKEEEAPYKKIVFEVDREGVSKIKKDESDFTYPKGDLGLTADKIAAVQDLHNYIFNLFADHWNSDERIMSFKKGGAGGARRTRKSRLMRRKKTRRNKKSLK